MITLVRTVQTSYGCPSQWDAWDADGNYYYMRYRHGHGQVRHYADSDWVNADVSLVPEVVADFSYGHPLDGVMDLAEFVSHTDGAVVLAEDLDSTDFGQHMTDELILHGITELLEREK